MTFAHHRGVYKLSRFSALLHTGHAMEEKVKETLHSDLQNIFARRYA